MTTDLETVFTGLSTYIQQNINARIAAINTEKGDSVLSAFNSQAWLEGSLDEKVKSFNQFGFCYLDDIQNITHGISIVDVAIFECDLVFAQSADFMDYKRILRYQRALREVAQGAWGKVLKGHDRAEIQTLSPLDVKLFNSSYWYKVIGIRIEFNLAN
jgi:hypothetical protein